MHDMLTPIQDHETSIPEPASDLSQPRPAADETAPLDETTLVNTIATAAADNGSSATGIHFPSLLEVTSVSGRSQDLFSAPSLELESAIPLEEGLDAEMWPADDSGTTYWPFMPYFSQLESLPHDFDMASMQ